MTNTNTIHVLCAENLADRHVDQLRDVSPRLAIHIAKDKEDIASALTPETEVLLASRIAFDLSQAPNLRWVQLFSAGVDHLRDTPIWTTDITLTSANGVHAVQIAEYVLAMMLAHGHHLPHMYRLQLQRTWASDEQRKSLETSELRDATLGILGYGAIGREVARLATAFGMRVLATSRMAGTSERPRFDGWTPAGTGDADGSLPERYYSLDDLHSLLQECDVVVLALPLSDRTHHVIGSAELEAMQSDALLINIGRGALIDQEALIEALQAGKIGGAALDVTDPEPLPEDHPLWSLENVILTPHISGGSPRYTDRVVDLFAANLQRYLAGETLINEVSRERGY